MYTSDPLLFSTVTSPVTPVFTVFTFQSLGQSKVMPSAEKRKVSWARAGPARMKQLNVTYSSLILVLLG